MPSCETTKSLKISVTYLTLVRSKSIYQDLKQRRTETTHQQWVGRSESHNYWMCFWLVAPASMHMRSCWWRTFWAHAVIKMMWY